MPGLEALDVAIGLAFLYLILSLVASSLRELIEGYLQTRAVHLERGIRELLHDKTGKQIVTSLFGHPLVCGLFRGEYDPDTQLRSSRKLFGKFIGKDVWPRLRTRTTLPAYIPARNFALAMLDVTGRGPLAATAGQPLDPSPLSFAQIRAGVQALPSEQLRRVMLVSLDQAKGDLDQARLSIEAWFDSGMDRVSGWYRKETQWILFGIGLLLAISLNVDSVSVARALHNSDGLREIIVAEATETVRRVPVGARQNLIEAIQCPPDRSAAQQALPPATTGSGALAPIPTSCAQQRLEKLGYPIGWGEQSFSISPQRVLGWLLTACALSLGAPFWFDLLNKMMVIRSTVKPHEKSPEESSEDRQAGPRRNDGPPPAPPPGGAGTPPGPPPAPPPIAAIANFVPNQWANDDPDGGKL